jgi:hypothetical protein
MGASATGPLGSASAQVNAPRMPAPVPPPMKVQTPAALKAPAIPVAGTQNKMVLLFIALGVLAIVLVVIIVLLLK